MALDPGSFRDPDSRVFLTDDGVFRAPQRARTRRLAAAARRDGIRRGDRGRARSWRREAVERDAVPWVSTGSSARRCSATSACRSSPTPTSGRSGCCATPRCCSSTCSSAALAESLMLKDSSPYNVQWRGASPVFIDVGSFERLREGEPWVGYRQFCMLFLYPLMLQAYRDVPFQPWLRGSTRGHHAGATRRGCCARRDRLRRGVLTNVRPARPTRAPLRRRRGTRGRARAALGRLQHRAGQGQRAPACESWSTASALGARARRRGPDYGEDDGYADADREAKAAFVREAAGRRRRRLAWDLGANDGDYARIAAETADCVLAMDADHPTVELLYRTLRDERRAPHPAARRRRLRPVARARLARARARSLDRARPAATSRSAWRSSITSRSPATSRSRELVDWLAEPRRELVVEFPTREDPMVRRLLAAKREGAHADYELERLRALLRRGVRRSPARALPSGHARPLRARRPAVHERRRRPRDRGGHPLVADRRAAPRRPVVLRLRPAAVRPARRTTPTFFIARGNTAGDILRFAFVARARRRRRSWCAAEALARRSSRDGPAGRLHLAFVAILAGAFALELLKRALPGAERRAAARRRSSPAPRSPPPTRAPPGVRSFVTVLAPGAADLPRAVPRPLADRRAAAARADDPRRNRVARPHAGRSRRLRRAAHHLADGDRAAHRLRALPGLRAAGTRVDVVSQRDDRLRQHDASPCRRSSPGCGPAASGACPRAAPIRAACSRCSASRWDQHVARAGHRRLPARHLPRRAHARAPASAWSALASDLSVVSGHLLLPDDLADIAAARSTAAGRTSPAPSRAWPASLAPNRAPRAPTQGLVGRVRGRGGARDRRRPPPRRTRPPLHVIHVVAPHVPWRYLPSGLRYPEPGPLAIPGLARDRGLGPPTATSSARAGSATCCRSATPTGCSPG